jgi:hypothetical protein
VDEAADLDDGDPVDLAQQYGALRRLSGDIRGFVGNGIYIAAYNLHEMWREA